MFVVPAAAAFASTPTNNIVLETANRLVTLQNTNGSWDWIVTDASAPTSDTYYNVTGVTAQELLDAYALNPSTGAAYLTAAETAGNYIVTSANSTTNTDSGGSLTGASTGRQNAYNIVFLQSLGAASGISTYTNEATTILTTIFGGTNYWTTNNGNNCTTSGCTPAQLVAGDENYRNGIAVPDGIVAWDLEPYVQAEMTVGGTTAIANAHALEADIVAYVTNTNYTSSISDYSLGLSSAVRAAIAVGDTANEATLLVKLDAAQDVGDGHFGTASDGQDQATAYALDALMAANDSHATAAASYLNTNFTYNNGSGIFNGWLETGTPQAEYAEIDSEAAHALSATLPAVTTNPANPITSTDATLNGTNGPLAAGQESFWVSTAPFVTTSPNIPAGVFSTPVFTAPASLAAGGTFSTALSTLNTDAITTGGATGVNLPAITPGSTYYYVAWSNVNGTWYPGAVLSFTTSAPAAPTPVTVTIDKFIDGHMATAANANSASFPMIATWNNFGADSGTGGYALSTTPFNSLNAYEAVTENMNVGSSYTTNEDTTGSSVGASCASGKPFALVGYSWGTSPTAAAAMIPTTAAPNFTNITQNEYVIVWNKDCLAAPILSSPASATVTTTAGLTGTSWNSVTDPAGGITYVYQSSNSSATNPADGSFVTPAYTSGSLTTTNIPTPSTPAGVYSWHVQAKDADGNLSPWSTVWTFTISNPPTIPANACNLSSVPGFNTVNGAAGNVSVTLAPNTMFVGTGNGNDTIKAPAAGEYIICLGSGNSTVTVGAGNSYIKTTGGNSIIKTGDGNETVLTGSGNDTITTGNGNSVITSTGGNNVVKTGTGYEVITTGSGNDTITTQSTGNLITPGGGNNTVHQL